MKRAIVVVLGDLGHSPRIINQALSIANLPNYKVDLVGYKDSKLPIKILEKENININYLSQIQPLPPNLPAYLYLLYAPFKALFLFFSLLSCLLQLPTSDFILIQNPPAIPTLIVVQLVCFIKQSQLIIDWHNFGYSILSLKLGISHPIVKFAYFYEKLFAKWAFIHITVTEAMASELKNEWKVSGKIIVVHDKSAEEFQPMELSQIHEFMLQLENTQSEFQLLKKQLYIDDEKETSLITEKNQEVKIEYRKNRVKLIVSSTSWTPDEDFSILLKAIEIYNTTILSNSNINPTKLAIIITGKGPEKENYELKIKQLNDQLTYVKIITTWLPIAFYPKLLACADLGISLHLSSSGLDLPMKIVDMFGTGLPVCAMDFMCLSELVQHNKNGLVFSSAEELALNLESLFLKKENRSIVNIEELKEGALEFGKVKWEQHWNDKLKEVFMD
ncbi:hypothetical protein K502DRAFT_303844 [Neoconidiobolus thromboides FSU 785]|nr:hypothetical protein K502DRAFT_303844 [Neoconidiobolus thromboides FSU 785]